MHGERWGGTLRRDGDGYIECEQGHQHWGRHGAAGLLIRHIDSFGQVRYLLTHRSPEVHQGDCYGIPGGAIDSHESPVEGANREAEEEIGGLPMLVNYHVVHENDHGDWKYTTVMADAIVKAIPFLRDDNWETESVDWFTPEEIDELNLHPGFAETWRIVTGK